MKGFPTQDPLTSFAFSVSVADRIEIVNLVDPKVSIAEVGRAIGIAVRRFEFTGSCSRFGRVFGAYLCRRVSQRMGNLGDLCQVRVLRHAASSAKWCFQSVTVYDDQLLPNLGGRGPLPRRLTDHCTYQAQKLKIAPARHLFSHPLDDPGHILMIFYSVFFEQLCYVLVFPGRRIFLVHCEDFDEDAGQGVYVLCSSTLLPAFQ